MSYQHKNTSFFSYFPYLLFFLFGVIYFWKFTEYLFFTQEKASLFLLSSEYFMKSFQQPGGFLSYLGSFQTSLYYYPLLGAVCVMLVLCGIVFLLQLIGKICLQKQMFLLPFIVGALLLYLQINEEYTAINNLGIFCQLLLFFAFVSVGKAKSRLALLVFPLNYILFGAFSLLFAFLASIYLIRQKKTMVVLLALFIVALVFWIGKEFMYFQTTTALLVYPFTVAAIGKQSILFTTTIVLMLLMPGLGTINLGGVNKLLSKRIGPVEIVPLLIVSVLVFLCFRQVDEKKQKFYHAEKLFYQQRYAELVAFNQKNTSSNLLTLFANNVALAETGQLASKFFHFKQSPQGKTLFFEWDIVGAVLRKGGYFYYSLGMINEAQRWAYEYWVMRGNSPEVLKMLIKTDLIKGKFELAEKYISILEQSMFYRKDALAFRALLHDKTAIAMHPELGPKQKADTKIDFFVQADKPLYNLEQVVKSDSLNYIAIEYKLAGLMLQKDMQGLVNMLPLLEQAGYHTIPKNVEEAVVAYKLMRVGNMPELQHLKIKRKTEQEFQQFYKLYRQNSGNKKLAQKALHEFSNTYWYYVFFG